MRANINPVVVLIGFSTAGKSYFLRQVQEKYENIRCLDSDRWISLSTGNEHIFELFMQNGREALGYIGDMENAFLETYGEPPTVPTLIAAGPFLLNRPLWPAFVTKIRPYLIHLDVTAEQVYDGLMQRRQQQAKLINENDPLFGSWDADVTTRFVDGRYQLLPKNEALKNILGILSRQNERYIAYRDISFPGRDVANKAAIMEMIEKALLVQ